MEFSGLGDKEFRNVRFERRRFSASVPIPKGKTGRHRAGLPSVLVPGSVLGARRRVALFSAQVSSMYPRTLRPCKSLLLGSSSPLGVGGRSPLRVCLAAGEAGLRLFTQKTHG